MSKGKDNRLTEKIVVQKGETQESRKQRYAAYETAVAAVKQQKIKQQEE